MPVFPKWQPEWSLGIGLIDADHKTLGVLIGTLDYGVKHGCEDRILFAALDLMDEHVARHFPREEWLLEAVGLPTEEIAAHKADHRRFKAKVQAFKQGVGTFGAKAVVAEARAFARHWFQTHVVDEVARLKPLVAGREKELEDAGDLAWVWRDEPEGGSSSSSGGQDGGQSGTVVRIR